MMRRYPRLSFLLGPRELQGNDKLCDYLEQQGRNRVLFRSAGEAWPAASALALTVPLSPSARRAYLAENAARVFGFPGDAVTSLSA
jgi:predicted TIM-barrel fold metal-dependent hydrolase